MPIVQKGAINTTALLVPDVYVQIVPPQVAELNGVPTNVLGVVGTASWGPVNSPAIFGDMAGYAEKFGPIKARKYDMGTQVAVAVLQGANNFRGVRVTDGTDTAATVSVLDTAGTPATGIDVTGKYTGTLGNGISVDVADGSKTNSYKVTVSMPGRVPEVFDNITGTGAALWQAMADAINNGISGLRGPSNLVVATVASSTATPAVASYNLAGGTDGATTIDSSVMLGQDTGARSGMYSLRDTAASVALLADMDDTTSWTDQVAFGLAEGIYMILVGPNGQDVSTGVSAKTTAAIDSYAAKVMLGDWVYFQDTVNDQQRLISPQGFAAGRIINLSPEQSSLNKPIYGIVATQKTAANQQYSSADIQALAAAGIDVITAPAPGGDYFACRIGHNASSNALTNGDNYTRMTNYIASTLNAGMGVYIGQVQSATERLNAKSTLDHFLQNMEDQGMIGDPNGGPAFSVVLDASNNPTSRVALGYQQADVKVKYLGIVEKFLINVEGNSAVTITHQAA